MKLRCKPGDVAMITWDYRECLENLGRLVQVGGPLKMSDGQWVWRIQPVTPELYAVLETDNSLVREHVTWKSRVQHPDAWMVPIRPPAYERESDEACANERSKGLAKGLAKARTSAQGAVA